MNILRKSIVIGFTVLGMAAANAQEAKHAAAPHDATQRKEHMQAKMADMYAKRQARLHDLLKLTTQQESAWASYQAAIKPTATGGDHPDRQAFEKMTTPQRLSMAVDMGKKRQAALESHLKAATAFYAVLNPAQQSLFDEHSFGGERGGMMHARWGHQRGGWGHGDEHAARRG